MTDTLTVRIRENNLVIGLDDIVSCLTEEQLRELSKNVVFQKTLMEGICDALIDGFMWEDSWWFASDFFNQLRIKLMPLMDDVAAEAVASMRYKSETSKYTENKARDMLHELLKNWNSGICTSCYEKKATEGFGYYYPGRKWTKEQAKEYINDKNIERQAIDEESLRNVHDALGYSSGYVPTFYETLNIIRNLVLFEKKHRKCES